eukprot:1714239-Amphidinium_carterae.1
MEGQLLGQTFFGRLQTCMHARTATVVVCARTSWTVSNWQEPWRQANSTARTCRVKGVIWQHTLCLHVVHLVQHKKKQIQTNSATAFLNLAFKQSTYNTD